MPDLRGTVRRDTVELLGGRVGVLEVGQPGPEPTFLLLHGIPASAEVWRGVLELLGQAGRHAIAVDLPGYGTTRLPRSVGHGLLGAAEVARALADRRGEPVELVGHDIGGGVAQIAAVRDAAPWATLTLSHAVTHDLWPPRFMQPMLATTRRFGPRAGRRALLGSPTPVVGAVLRGYVFGDGSTLSEASLRRIFLDGKVTDADGREAFERHLDALAHANATLTIGVSSRVAESGIPLRLVWGDADPMLPLDRVGAWWTQRRPDVPMTVLAGAGHFSPVEQPAAFVAGLLGPASPGPS